MDKYQIIDTINNLIELLETKGVKTKTYDNGNDRSVNNKKLREFIEDYEMLKYFAFEENYKSFIYYLLKKDITHERLKTCFKKYDKKSLETLALLNKRFFESCLLIMPVIYS